MEMLGEISKIKNTRTFVAKKFDHDFGDNWRGAIAWRKMIHRGAITWQNDISERLFLGGFEGKN